MVGKKEHVDRPTDGHDGPIMPYVQFINMQKRIKSRIPMATSSPMNLFRGSPRSFLLSLTNSLWNAAQNTIQLLEKILFRSASNKTVRLIGLQGSCPSGCHRKVFSHQQWFFRRPLKETDWRRNYYGKPTMESRKLNFFKDIKLLHRWIETILQKWIIRCNFT